MNLYQYCGNNPVNWVDPLGWAVIAIYDGSDPGHIDPRERIADGEDFRKAAAAFDYSIDASNLQDAVIKLRNLKEQGIVIDEIYIFDHGSSGSQQVGKDHLLPSDKEWEKMSNMMEKDGIIHLRGCYVALGEKGRKFLSDLANKGNVTVDAYSGSTSIGKRRGFYFHRCRGELWTAKPNKGAKHYLEPYNRFKNAP